MMRSVPQFQISDSDTQRAVESLAQAVNALVAIPLVNGATIASIVLVANVPKEIPHKLGTVLTGWFVVDRSANAVVWQNTSKHPEKTLVLVASANVTISIWVF